ncbi:uncharacterized protein LOC118202015 isoform X2 [Stegodyphus dumicola]|uniref:uncharacterized protein LOC118202015 isoform X2 n=1 Tax=Stegodyphus dumicola TaxID=202533 RepID=UPI0015A8D9D5|nr:uncharacterized protein LOC118202015 isoform X2 [Stegodyphus dumicola]
MFKRQCTVLCHLTIRTSKIAVLSTFDPTCTTAIHSLPQLRNVFLFFIRHLGSSQGVEQKDVHKKKSDIKFPERTLTVYTCENIYETWRRQKKFYHIPESGVFADIAYIDTVGCNKNTNNEKTPTVLCIHGIPGNYGVFSHLINDLSNEGVRVIVPTFPATLYLSGKHKKELFRHSVEEKTQVFKDFLKALDVSELDGIIAHSSAIYPALRLALDSDLKVNSQVFFNTGGHRETVTMKPYWVVWICSYLYLNAFGRMLVQKIGKFLMKYVMRTPIKDDNFDGIMLLAITMVFSECWNASEEFQAIAQKKIPTLYAFSEDDKVVEKKLTYDVISLLGACEENINFYDKNGVLKKEGKDLHWLTLISFEEGSHYVFRKYPQLCNMKVLELLKRTRS